MATERGGPRTVNDKDPTRVECVVCGKISAGRKPQGGDGTFRYPRFHYVGDPSMPCEGNFVEARWVAVDPSRSTPE